MRDLTVVLLAAVAVLNAQQASPRLGLGVREPALQLLLGALPDKAPDLAKLAGTTSHVDRDDPPLLIFHGFSSARSGSDKDTRTADLQVCLDRRA